MSPMDLWIRRHVRRLEFGRYLNRLSEFLGLFCLAFGMLILGSKIFLPQWWPNILWLGLSCVPLGVLACLWKRRRPFTAADSVVFLDNRLGSGGLLMTLYETSDRQWDEFVPQADALWREALPRFQSTRYLKRLGVPLAFAAICCLIPLRAVPQISQSRNMLSAKAAADLEQLLELVEKQQLLDQQQVEQLRKEIEEFARKTAQRPLTHENWETVDALREKLGLQLETAARQIQQGQAAAQAAHEASQASTEALDADRLAEWESAIREALKQIPGDQQASGGLPSELQELLKQAQTNGQFQLPPDLQEHAQALKQLAEFLESEAEKLDSMRPGTEPGGSGADGQATGDGLLDGNASSEQPGQGGITRGRGDAELSLGEESDSQASKFKSVVLPPGFLDQTDSNVLRVTKSAPTAEPAAAAARTQQRQLDPASGRATWNRKLQPKHRRIVKQYFESE